MLAVSYCHRRSWKFLCQFHLVIFYFYYFKQKRAYPHSTQHCAKPSLGATLQSSRQRLMQLPLLLIPTPLTSSLLARAPDWPIAMSSSSLLLLLLSTRGCRDSVWAPTEWLTASRKLHSTVSVAVKPWQAGHDLFVAQRLALFRSCFFSFCCQVLLCSFLLSGATLRFGKLAMVGFAILVSPLYFHFSPQFEGRVVGGDLAVAHVSALYKIFQFHLWEIFLAITFYYEYPPSKFSFDQLGSELMSKNTCMSNSLTFCDLWLELTVG